MRKVVFIITGLLLSLASSSYTQIPHKILICGVCKNVATRVPFSIKIMETIGNLFEDYRIIVYENNSSDNTSQILKKWTDKNPRVNVTSETIPYGELEKIIIHQIILDTRTNKKSLFPPEAIARARNIVLKKALSPEYDTFEYLIWMDMDFKLEPNYAGIKELFQTNREWDAVFAYGIDPEGSFWDWFALRDTIEPLGPELLGWDWYVAKQRTITQQDDWYPVYSAFGGCGIYKKSSIRGCKYSAFITPDLAHVAHTIIEQGKKDNHPAILKYVKNLATIAHTIHIDIPHRNLPEVHDPVTGITLHSPASPLIWRMNSFAYRYPVVCEHVTFHASMIRNGHDKLFINPRLIFRYGG